MGKIISLLLVLLLFIINCKNTENTKSHKIGECKAPFTNGYEEIFKEPKLIFLETTDKSLIGYVKEILETSNFIFILDIQQNKVLCFDKNGRYIKQIGKNGKGPGEYLRPIDILYSKKDKCLWVYDSKSRKIIAYSQEGKILNEKKISFYCKNFIETPNGYLAFIGNSPFGRKNNRNVKFLKLDKEFNILKKIKGGNGFTHDIGTYVASLENSQIFVEPFNYGIFELRDDNIEKMVSFDFGRKSFTNEMKIDLASRRARDVAEKLVEKSFVTGFCDLHTNNDLIMLEYRYKKRIHFVFFSSVKNGIIQEFPSFLIKKDGWETFMNPVCIYDEMIVEAVMPSTFFFLQKQSNSPKRQEALDSICSMLNENSNPVLIKHRLKSTQNEGKD